MGNRASSAREDDVEDDFVEEDVDVEEDEEVEEDEDGDVPEEEGFNMVFSPELVRRLQGRPDDEEDEDEDEDEDSGDGIEAHLAEAERLERERREQERLAFVNLSRQEKMAAAELDSLIKSAERGGEGSEAARSRRATSPAEGPCAAAQAASVECLRVNRSFEECEDLIRQFEACVKSES